jgi:uncharacterized protein
MLTSAASMAGIAGIVFLAFCLLLWWRQENFLFHPRPNDALLRKQWHVHRVEIPSADIALEGWWADNPAASNAAVIVYFGGNGEDILYTATTARHIDARRALFVNYRGYGGTPGKPTQKALFEDALAIYDYVVASGVAPENIVVMGRSLGSGVATMLAATRRVRGAILVTPYDSIAAVAARHYAFLPVRMLLRHPFPASDYAKNAHVPALMLAGATDFIVPAIHAQRLHEAWAGPKEIHILPGAGHNNIEQQRAYYDLINQFLRSAAQTTGF